MTMCNVKGGILSDGPAENDHPNLKLPWALCGLLASFLALCFCFNAQNFTVLVQPQALMINVSSAVSEKVLINLLST